jgi:alpha-glucosidase (family GH31 glycosyl hydrolase)
MPAPVVSDQVVLARGELTLEISLLPFAFVLRRSGRRLLRAGGVWVADGVNKDHFVQFSEGIVPNEQLSPPEPGKRAWLMLGEDTGANGHSPQAAPHAVKLGLRLHGGRDATLDVALTEDERVDFTLRAAGEPLRLALEWDKRSQESYVGLGARHGTQLDQRGRAVQLGADRRYTGPDCPPEMLAEGGIPQGDCAPTPWLLSSRGYAVLVHTFANGTRFDLSKERVSVSTRAAAGDLQVTVFTASTPAARLRRYCAHSGFPKLLPEWAYGFWKSRDVHEHQDDVLEDFNGFKRNHIPLDAIVIDSPWATQYNTWDINPYQFPQADWMIKMMRSQGVRTVLWCTPWVNLDSRDGQIPPQPESERLHREPASNYAEGAASGHFVKGPDGLEPFVNQWWMGTGSPIDFTNPSAEAWWREQVKRVLHKGVEGIKMDDGDGFYIHDDVVLHDGRRGVESAWDLGGRHRLSLQRALDEVHPGTGVLFGRSGWTGQHATGFTWAGDQASDFWSLRVLVVATLQAALSGYSNWSHDVGGYLGHRLVERCPPELLVRWIQFGCFTPLMQAHARMQQEPWHYGADVMDLYRAYAVLHEQLVPYVRAAARTASKTGLPIIRPLCLTDPADPRGWTLTDAYGYGPALWVAPILDDGARERDVVLPRGSWIEAWTGNRVDGGGEVVAPGALHGIPLWVRDGSIVVTYPAEHVAGGLGDTPEAERPLTATLWGEPRLGHTAARLADGTLVRYRRGRWSVDRDREIEFREQP